MAYSPLASPRATADVLARFGLSTRKSLGQHFLIDDHIVGRTVELALLDAGHSVLEVGPGIGTLTVALLSASAGVVAIEKDPGLLPALRDTTSEYADRLAIIEDDATRMTAEAVDAAAAACGIPSPRQLVANLPYAVAATVVLDFFERIPDAQSATVMVQSEVADRMAASPGTKDYGAYSVKLSLRAKPAGRFQVSPNCFFPPPRVESSVIRLDACTPVFGVAPASPRLVDAACMAADACFLQRRKTVRNSLSAYLKSYQADTKGASACPGAESLLESAGINPGVRGETLLQDDYLRLGQVFIANGLA